jgi:EmrB/QacA subfamily drug resistance transporter
VNFSPVNRTAVLVIILISYFMILLDNSIIFTGLPSIQRELGFSPAALTWVQDAYTLTFGGLLLLAARAGDIIGRRRLFLVGLVVFSVASLLVGLAQSETWMIAARALQGIGAAIVAPASLSLLTATFPAGAERNRAVALYAATAGIGASLGMVVGGVFAEAISWRAGFFINLPIGAAMIVLAARYLVEQPRTPGRFDVIGALCSTLGVGAIILGIIESSESGWLAPLTLASLAIGVVLLVALVLNERRAPQPIMPLRLFASRDRSGAYAIRFLYLGAMMGFFFFTTQYLQNVLGFTPLQAGLGFLPMTIVNFAVALAVPRLNRRVPSIVLLAAGILMTLGGMFWLSFVSADSTYLTAVGLPMLLIGFGQGLVFAPLTSYGISGVAGADAGAASGLLNTAHQLGSSVGLAILVTLASSATASAQTHAALTGSTAMLGVALIVAVAVILPGEIVRRRESALALSHSEA